MRLDHYDSSAFERGRPWWVEGLWMLVQALLVSSSLPGSWHRVALLRLFGAKIGAHVRIKPGVLVKFPWRLTVGDWSWLGERVWIDNLAQVSIGSHAVISQRAYLCTGDHDMRSDNFDLLVRPIVIDDSSWICAGSILGPGAIVGRGAVLGLGAVGWGTLESGTVYRGNPAVPVGRR